ncbi:MAG: GerMN domain-containing protein, partial [Propionibacteriales bacterium]|nr:GerMN domain-containing protein [Propionibacteriales bacterium]
ARDDDGQTGRKIGCGDSLVATYTGPQTFSSQLEASMEWLLSHRDRELGGSGLYNALHQSELQFQSGHVDGDTVTVALTGTLAKGGSCDAPRIKAQLRQTAMTSVGAGNARITVNGTPLSQLLGGKG